MNSGLICKLARWRPHSQSARRVRFDLRQGASKGKDVKIALKAGSFIMLLDCVAHLLVDDYESDRLKCVLAG
jgi:hypothetical protein